MSRKCQRRPAKGGAAVCDTRRTAGVRQAHSAALDRACLSCGEPGVIGLCDACYLERFLDRLAELTAEQAALLAFQEGPSVPILPVRPHPRPRPSQLRTRPELDVALEWRRQPRRGFDGWFWQAGSLVPVPLAEALATRGQG